MKNQKLRCKKIRKKHLKKKANPRVEQNIVLEKTISSFQKAGSFIFVPFVKKCMADNDYWVMFIAFILVFLFHFFKDDIRTLIEGRAKKQSRK